MNSDTVLRGYYMAALGRVVNTPTREDTRFLFEYWKTFRDWARGTSEIFFNNLIQHPRGFLAHSYLSKALSTWVSEYKRRLLTIWPAISNISNGMWIMVRSFFRARLQNAQRTWRPSLNADPPVLHSFSRCRRMLLTPAVIQTQSFNTSPRSQTSSLIWKIPHENAEHS